MNLTQILCDNISKRRRKIGLTQAALAERLQISPEAMTRIEKGSIAPRLSRLENIARNLQCSVPDLFRPYSDKKSDKIAIIEDALVGLPEEVQDAIVHLVVETTRILHGKYDKD